MTQQTTKSDMLNVRIDPCAKAQAAQICERGGLNLSDAVRMFVTRINIEGKLPAALILNEQDHDAWIRAKVLQVLENPGPTCSHEEVMAGAKEIIDKKRNA